MATESVAIATKPASAASGSNHDLWITEDSVLTIGIDKRCREFPPNLDQCGHLNNMIQGLARAAKGCDYDAIVDRLIGRIEGLEKTRHRLLQKSDDEDFVILIDADADIP